MDTISNINSGISNAIGSLYGGNTNKETSSNGLTTSSTINKQPSYTAANGYGTNISPVAKPVSVVSSNTAVTGDVANAKNIVDTSTQNATKKSTIAPDISTQNSTALTNAGNQNAYYPQIRIDANGNQYTVNLPNPNYRQGSSQDNNPISPVDQATSDAQDAVLHPGQTKYFNKVTGQAEWITTPTASSVNASGIKSNTYNADGSTTVFYNDGTSETIAAGAPMPGETPKPPSGYSTQDPKTRTDVTNSVSAPGGIIIKQFSDGTYGRFNLTTGDYSQVSSADFQSAQDVANATTALNNLINGILTPSQQSQVDSITAQYTALIQKQQTANANITGANTIAENLYGMGNTIAGQGVIQQTINDGISKISALQAQMSSAISDMKNAFQTNDMNLLNSAYKEFDDSNTGIQKSLDTVQATLQKQQDKIDAANISIASAMAKKYQDTDTPILPGDSPDVLKQKLSTSPTWQQNSAIQASLTKEEAEFVGQMGLAGADVGSILPSLGLGKAATSAKIQILKSIIDNAKTLGVSAEEVAQSLIDKQAAAKTYQRLLTQGSLLAAAETKTEADFQNVKKLGAKLDGNEIKIGIPLIQGWIRSGTLALSNNADLNNYLANLTTTLTNYGRVVAGQTGQAGITNAANTEAQNLLNSGFSVDTVNSFIDNSAIPDMKNTILGYTTSLNSMDNAINTANGSVNPTSQILGSVLGSTPAATNSSSPTQVQTNSNGSINSVDF